MEIMKMFVKSLLTICIQNHTYVMSHLQLCGMSLWQMKTRVDIPKQKDGSKYSLKNLSKQQQVVVIAAVDTIVKFLKNNKKIHCTFLKCSDCKKHRNAPTFNLHSAPPSIGTFPILDAAAPNSLRKNIRILNNLF